MAKTVCKGCGLGFNRFIDGEWLCGNRRCKFFGKKKETMEQRVCSICFNNFSGFGNNAEPINEGVCCDSCNNLVISARINNIYR